MQTELVDTKYKTLANTLLHDCDWSWTQTARLVNGDPLTGAHIADYQVFILCKVIAGDLKVDAETKRLRLSPTRQIDEVWHQHLLRPVSYYEMCRKLHQTKEEAPSVGLNPLDCLIDHSPDSSNDSEEVKNERYKRTKAYAVELFSASTLAQTSLHPLDPGNAPLLSNGKRSLEDLEDQSRAHSFCEDEEQRRTKRRHLIDLTCNTMNDESEPVEENVPEEDRFTVRIKSLTEKIYDIPNVYSNMKIIQLKRIYQEFESSTILSSIDLCWNRIAGYESSK